jgi:hypothetical protein
MSRWTNDMLIAEALGYGLVDYAADRAQEAACFGMLDQDAARLVADAPGCPAWYVTWWRSWASRGARP